MSVATQMAAELRFAVEFLGEDAMEVVPSKWLHGEGKVKILTLKFELKSRDSVKFPK